MSNGILMIVSLKFAITAPHAMPSIKSDNDVRKMRCNVIASKVKSEITTNFF